MLIETSFQVSTYIFYFLNVNANVLFLISNSNPSLLVYKKVIDFYIFTWSLSTMQWSLVSSRTYFVDFCNFPQKQPCHGQTKSFISSFPICVLFNSFGSPVLFSSPILLNYLWYFFLYQVVFYSLFFSSLNLAVFLGNSPVVQQFKDPAGVQVTTGMQKTKDKNKKPRGTSILTWSCSYLWISFHFVSKIECDFSSYELDASLF